MTTFLISVWIHRAQVLFSSVLFYFILFKKGDEQAFGASKVIK